MRVPTRGRVSKCCARSAKEKSRLARVRYEPAPTVRRVSLNVLLQTTEVDFENHGDRDLSRVMRCASQQRLDGSGFFPGHVHLALIESIGLFNRSCVATSAS